MTKYSCLYFFLFILLCIFLPQDVFWVASVIFWSKYEQQTSATVRLVRCYFSTEITLKLFWKCKIKIKMWSVLWCQGESLGNGNSPENSLCFKKMIFFCPFWLLNQSMLCTVLVTACCFWSSVWLRKYLPLSLVANTFMNYRASFSAPFSIFKLKILLRAEQNAAQ